ncbi:uncharacterized protein LOC125646883 [Ostrea edulis]|uniref:uncharacterized protein LOC125646883 n=1 Tax=Ostrea edulis TaxID=37623 RepID=UPI0024AF357C|nr:uncharacterized protein LOC125646883 [Ostrea edulis]
MLEVWEFVLILVGVEALVGIVAGVVIWRKQNTKKADCEFQRDLLDELSEDAILDDLYEADDVEVGVPPQNYQQNDAIQLKTFRQLSNVSDFREVTSEEPRTRRTSILSEVALPDVDPRPAPMIIAANDSVFYGNENDVRPPSYHTRMSYDHFDIGEELTPVNTPSPTRLRRTLAITETPTGSLSRPKMGDPTPFSFFSEKTDMSTVNGELKKPLWDSDSHTTPGDPGY